MIQVQPLREQENNREAFEGASMEPTNNTDHIPEIADNNYDFDHFEVPRNSKDPEQNSFGRELITFYRSYDIHILNGKKRETLMGK